MKCGRLDRKFDVLICFITIRCQFLQRQLLARSRSVQSFARLLALVRTDRIGYHCSFGYHPLPAQDRIPRPQYC